MTKAPPKRPKKAPGVKAGDVSEARPAPKPEFFALDRSAAPDGPETVATKVCGTWTIILNTAFLQDHKLKAGDRAQVTIPSGLVPIAVVAGWAFAQLTGYGIAENVGNAFELESFGEASRDMIVRLNSCRPVATMPLGNRWEAIVNPPPPVVESVARASRSSRSSY